MRRPLASQVQRPLSKFYVARGRPVARARAFYLAIASVDAKEEHCHSLDYSLRVVAKLLKLHPTSSCGIARGRLSGDFPGGLSQSKNIRLMNTKMSFRFAAGATFICLLAACSIKPGYAEVHLPAIESDNMMLQAGDSSRLFGDAAPGEVVTINYGGRKTKAAADGDGHWLANLTKLKAGENFDIVIKGSNTVTIKNVLVGQVWLCGGQSNMEFSVAQANDGAKEVAEANHDQIRLFMVKRAMAKTPVADVEGSWKVCDPASAAPFSAVGYYFGRALNQDLKTPVGLIESAWGGTPAQAWTSLEGLAADPVTNSRYRAIAKMQIAELTEALEKYEKLFSQWKADQEKATGGTKTPPPKKPVAVQYPYAPNVLCINSMIYPIKSLPPLAVSYGIRANQTPINRMMPWPTAGYFPR